APANPTIKVPQRLTLASFVTVGSPSGSLTVVQRLGVNAGPIASGGSIFTPTIVQGLAPTTSGTTSLLAGVAGELATAAMVFDQASNNALALIGGNESDAMVYLTGTHDDGTPYFSCAINPRTTTRPLHFF